MSDPKSIHNKYMKKCFALAKKAEGRTSPNPLVGAILVNKKGEVVSKGYHKGYGLSHAEVDCIENYEKAGGKSYSDLTLYVNLEPCNHYGKTPPCSDLIIKKEIKKVVAATLDPNPKHSGGIQKLKNRGVEVVIGVLENEAKKLNEVFFKNVKEKAPFVVVKTAVTLDGKIAAKTGSSKWITSDKSRKSVQKLRNRYDAILTSSNTIIKDNPSMTARGRGYKNPIRIILDTSLKTDPKSKIYNNDGVTVLLFYCEAKNHNVTDYSQNVELIKIKKSKTGKPDLKAVLKEIYKREINSVMIEAGGILCGEFLKLNLVDKIYYFIAPKIMGDKDGVNFIEGFDISKIQECRNFKITAFKNLNPDILLELYPD